MKLLSIELNLMLFSNILYTFTLETLQLLRDTKFIFSPRLN